MKRCPYCGEEIQDMAIFCRFCRHDLPPRYDQYAGQPPYGSSTDSRYSAANGYRQAPPCDGPGVNNTGSQWQQYGQPGYDQGYSGPDAAEMAYYGTNNAFDCGPEGKSRGIAALFAILLGCFGVHYFYLGKITGGIITILLTLVTCGMWYWVTLVQGILMFCMDNATFRNKYVLTNSQFPLF